MASTPATKQDIQRLDKKISVFEKELKGDAKELKDMIRHLPTKEEFMEMKKTIFKDAIKATNDYYEKQSPVKKTLANHEERIAHIEQEADIAPPADAQPEPA